MSCEKCDKPVKARGLCRLHYEEDRVSKLPICAVADCDNHSYCKDMCRSHYHKDRYSVQTEGRSRKPYQRKPLTKEMQLAKSEALSKRLVALGQRERKRQERKRKSLKEQRAIDTERNRVRRREKRSKITSIKESNPCKDCNSFFPSCCMQFDHIDATMKRCNISDMPKANCSWSEIEAEIAKCELVCANCHSIRTEKRRNSK